MAQLVDESVKCPKELNDVRKAIVGIIEDIKDGKDLMLIAGENLQALSEAVSGLEQIDDELADNLQESVNCLGLMTGEIIGILAKPAVVPTPVVEETPSA